MKQQLLTHPKRKSKVVNRRTIDNTIAKRKRTNNDLQNITQKTKDRATRTPLKTGEGVNSGAPECLAVPAPRVALTPRVTLVTNPVISSHA